MTDETQQLHEPTPDDDRSLLEPWMATLAREIGDEVEVPREMMWKRIEQRRAVTKARDSERGIGERQTATRFGRWRGIAAIAAVLVGGIAIGRYAMPKTAAPVANTMAQLSDSMAAPARVAMEEHLVRTVALLTAVRDRDPKQGPELDVTSWARELLGTTRLLLDEPSLRDDRTRALLQDLELVLMQIIDARGTSAPEVRSAPTETMRETNLLPRVRAVMTAATRREELTVLGDDE